MRTIRAKISELKRGDVVLEFSEMVVRNVFLYQEDDLFNYYTHVVALSTTKGAAKVAEFKSCIDLVFTIERSDVL